MSIIDKIRGYMVIPGKYGTARVHTADLDANSESQIRDLMDQPFVSGSKVEIMPDVHAGTGCVIGLTMTIDKVACPNLVGVDIGCGVLGVRFSGDNKSVIEDFDTLDNVIRTYIPNGKRIHDKEIIDSSLIEEFTHLSDLRCQEVLSSVRCEGKLRNLDRAYKSIGTLGSGNHFISLEEEEDHKSVWLIIHSGSRNIGCMVADYYQRMAYQQHPECTKTMAYCSDSLFEDYIHDMKIIQTYAKENRKQIARMISCYMNVSCDDTLESVHNYIDTDSMILRKGSVSAKDGERIIVPMNMSYGTFICEGRGNVDFNFSAPHGAGRVMSRREAFSSVDLIKYKKSMEGIYSTCVCESTKDESKFVYKDPSEIEKYMSKTARVVKRLHPVYNFKCTSK